MTRKLIVFILVGCWNWTGLFALSVDVSESPKSNLLLTLRAIASAKKSLLINAYELDSPEIESAIHQRIEDGIRVEILQEGQPVGGISPVGLDIQKRLAQSLSEGIVHGLPAGRYAVMTQEASAEKRRFRYDHAKYIVIDDSSVLVGSENFSPSGNPVPGSKKGTRGWQTLIHDSSLASHFTSLFQSDSSSQFGDIINLVRVTARPLVNFLDFNRLTDTPEMLPTFLEDSEPARSYEAGHVQLLTSPNTSLSGLVGFIRSTKSTLDLQLLSMSHRWGTTQDLSPLFLEILESARRKVKIRILLNDPASFGSDSDSAKDLVKEFRRIAKKEKLSLEASLADLKSMGVDYIHNKGALADGRYTLISSINWNRNSVENNRETALTIDSGTINQHYQRIFNSDWEARDR